MKHHSFTPCVVFIALSLCVSQLVAEERPAVGVWSFDGNLADTSGRGNEAFAASASASFAPGHSGQGLQCGGGQSATRRKQQDGRTCRRTRSRQGWRDDARVEPALPPTYRDRGLDSRRPPGAGEARGDTGNRKQQRPKHLTI